jgi:hypothetical protein
MPRPSRVDCSRTCRTYFRFALGEDLLPAKNITELVQNANDREFIQTTLRQALRRTRASVYLEELTVHAPEVAKDHIGPLVSALFEIADELDVKSDEGRGMYDLADNSLRIHWLLNVLVRARVDQAARIPMLRTAMQSASLHWYCDFAERCQRDHQTDQHERHTPDDQRYPLREKRQEGLALRPLVLAQAVATRRCRSTTRRCWCTACTAGAK